MCCVGTGFTLLQLHVLPRQATSAALSKLCELGEDAFWAAALGGDRSALRRERVQKFLASIRPDLDASAVDPSKARCNSCWWPAAVALTLPLQDVLSETPTLLPNLKFHDLVFGKVLGTGSFSTVKYAKHIVRGVSPALWTEYAVKVISTDLIVRRGR